MEKTSDFLQANVGNGWFNLPIPKSYKPTYTHGEKSYRDAVWGLHRDIVRYNLFKATCGFGELTGEETALLQNLYDYKQFKLRATDSKNVRIEKDVYAGPLDNNSKYINKETYLIIKSSDVAMDFIEV